MVLTGALKKKGGRKKKSDDSTRGSSCAKKSLILARALKKVRKINNKKTDNYSENFLYAEKYHTILAGSLKKRPTIQKRKTRWLTVR